MSHLELRTDWIGKVIYYCGFQNRTLSDWVIQPHELIRFWQEQMIVVKTFVSMYFVKSLCSNCTNVNKPRLEKVVKLNFLFLFVQTLSITSLCQRNQEHSEILNFKMSNNDRKLCSIVLWRQDLTQPTHWDSLILLKHKPVLSSLSPPKQRK